MQTASIRQAVFCMHAKFFVRATGVAGRRRLSYLVSMTNDANTLLETAELPIVPGASLQDKEAAACRCIDIALRAVGPQRLAVAWTGGKDSTLALALVRNRMAELYPGQRVRALSIDTGCKFPEIVAFRDHWAKEWDIDLTIVRPAVGLAAYPIAKDKLACCRDLKIVPLTNAIRDNDIAVLITGIRADEHPSRAATPPVESIEDPRHMRLHPILRFTEMDIWAYHMDRALPACDLYAQGYRSLGCVPCTIRPDADAPERSGRDADKEAQMQTLRSLGYF